MNANLYSRIPHTDNICHSITRTITTWKHCRITMQVLFTLAHQQHWYVYISKQKTRFFPIRRHYSFPHCFLMPHSISVCRNRSSLSFIFVAHWKIIYCPRKGRINEYTTLFFKYSISILQLHVPNPLLCWPRFATFSSSSATPPFLSILSALCKIQSPLSCMCVCLRSRLINQKHK